MNPTTNQPDHLYHYTSINTLALILASKKLRFNRLDHVDDTTEAISPHLGNIGRFVFVSCWTDSSEENIPLWSMYTPNMSGVRIKFPTKMFKTYEVKSNSALGLQVKGAGKMILPYEKMHTNSHIVMPVFEDYDQFLCEIEYTNEESKLNKNIHVQTGGHQNFKFGEFGRYKKEIWQFQSEWRFKLTILPTIGPDYKSPNFVTNFMDTTLKNIESGNLPFSDYFLELTDEAINNIEITLGPRCNESNNIIVETLLEKYCENSCIKNSALQIR
jgi:hypothetical protein